MQPSHFQWSVEGAVGRVVLNRPERKNPLTFESYAELRDLFRSAAGPHPNPPPRAGEGEGGGDTLPNLRNSVLVDCNSHL